jgi:TP901 family phage tail tape measure protein
VRGLSERQLTFVMKLRDQMSGQMAKVSGAFKRGAASVRMYAAGLMSAENRMRRLQRVAGTMGSAVAAMASGFLIFSAVNLMSDFGDRMSTVKAVTGATSLQFEQLRETAIRMGNSTRFTAGEAASALEELARAGMSVSESIESIQPALDLASAGALELGRSADIMTNVMAAFSLKTTEATRVADVLAVAAANSNTTVAQLADAFVYAGGTAGMFGASLEETAAAFGVLANFGRKASVAGSGLNTMLSLMAKGGKPLDAALKRVGSSSRDLLDIMAQEGPGGGLIGALQKMKDAQIDAAEATVIFGTRAGPTAAVLLENIEMLKNFEGMLRTTEQSARSIAFVMEDNLGGSLRRLKAAFQGFILSANQDQQGGLRNFVEMMALVIRYVTTGEAGMKDIRDTLNDLGWAGEDVEKKIRRLAIAFKILAAALAALLAVVVAGAAIAALAMAFAALGTGVGIVVVGVAALAGLFVAFKDDVVQVGDSMTTWGDTIAIVTSDVAAAFKWVFGKISDGFQWLVSAMGGVSDKGRGAFDAITQAMKMVANVSIASSLAMVKIFQTAFVAILAGGSAFAEEMKQILMSPIEAMQLTAAGDLGGAAKALLKTVPNYGKVGAAMGGAMVDGWKEAAGYFERDFVGEIGSAMGEGFAAISAGIEGYVDSVGERAAERTTEKFRTASRRALEQTKTFRDQLTLAQKQLDVANQVGDQSMIDTAEANLMVVQEKVNQISGMRADLLGAMADGDREAMQMLGEKIVEVHSENVSMTEKFAKEAFRGASADVENMQEHLDAAALATQRLKDRIRDAIAAMQAQAFTLNLSTNEQQFYNAAAGAGIDIINLQKTAMDKLGPAFLNFGALTDAQIKLIAKNKDEVIMLTGARDLYGANEELIAQQTIKRIADLGIEADMIRQITNVTMVEGLEREKQLAVIKAVNEAKKNHMILSREEIAAIEDLATAEYEASQKRMTVAESFQNRMREIGQETFDIQAKIGEFGAEAFNVLGDAMAKFFTGQKVNFKEMVADMLIGIAQTIIKMLALLAIFKLMDLVVPGSGTAAANMMGMKGQFGFATGAAFDASNRVISSPTVMRFRNSQGMQAGVMGEAGPEAIMPLVRGPSGHLGVRAQGGGGGGAMTNVFAPNVSITMQASGDEQMDRKSAEQLAGMVEQIMDKKMNDFYSRQVRSKTRLNGFG